MLKGPNTREFQECIVGINIFNKSTMGMKDSPYNRKRKNKMGRKERRGQSRMIRMYFFPIRMENHISLFFSKKLRDKLAIRFEQ